MPARHRLAEDGDSAEELQRRIQVKHQPLRRHLEPARGVAEQDKRQRRDHARGRKQQAGPQAGPDGHRLGKSAGQPARALQRQPGQAIVAAFPRRQRWWQRGVLEAIDAAALSREHQVDALILRNQLEGLRQQVDTAELPADWTAQLTELKDGSRELANQLATSGYAYHDGVYTATNGAAELAKGLGEMNSRVSQAQDGINQLVDGAAKIDDMSTTTKDRINGVQRALPAAAPVTGTAGAAAEGAGAGAASQSGAPTSSLPPLAAMLVSALAVLGGVAAALAAYAATRSRWSIIGLGTLLAAGAGTILVILLGTGLTPAAIGIAGLALMLGTLASAGITWVLRGAFGELGGTALAGIFALVQTGVVGWVWSRAATGDVDGVVRAVSSAMPMHWSTSAVSAAGNNGSTTAMWTGIGLSALLALIGLLGALRNRPATSSVSNVSAAASSGSAPARVDSHYDETAVLDTGDEIKHAR